MAFLHRYSIRHPMRVLLIGVLGTLALSPGLLKLRIRTDGHALVPAEAPEILYDRRIRDEFGINDSIVVLIRTNPEISIFNSRTLGIIDDLTNALGRIPGVRASDILSLATECGDRVRPGTLDFSPFLEPMPVTSLECQRVRNDVRAFELYSGTLVSRDETASAIYLGVPPDTDRVRLYRSVCSILETRTDAGHNIQITGAPVAEAMLGIHILQDLGVPAGLLDARVDRGSSIRESPTLATLSWWRSLIGRTIGLMPLAIGLMFAVFLISFRSVLGALLPLGEVAACLIAVFSLMGWFGVPVYLTIAVLPVILTAAGVSDEIHIFSRYTRELSARSGEDHGIVLAAIMDEMYKPVIKTTLTTAIGFLSFAFSPLGPVRAFGIFAFVGMMFCMLWSFSVIPASLALIDPRRFNVSRRRSIAGADTAAIAPVLARFSDWLVRRRLAVLLGLGAVLVIAPFGIRRVLVQDSWIENFSHDSGFFHATEAFNQQFLGMHVLQICAEATDEIRTGRLRPDQIQHDSLLIPPAIVADPANLTGRWIEIRPEPVQSLPTRQADAVPYSVRIETAAPENGVIRVTFPKRTISPILRLQLAADQSATIRILSRPFMLPEALRRIADLEQFIAKRAQDCVGGVLGPGRFMATANSLAHGRDPSQRLIPDDPATIERLWTWYERIRGTARMRQGVDPDFRRGIVTVFMKNANFIDTGRLMGAVRDYEHTQLAPHGIRLGFAGDVGVSQTLIDGIVRTEVSSVVLSVLGTLSITIVLSRSLVFGFFCVLPSVLSVPLTFAAMGWLAIPLGVATSMFAAMTLGIGVDFAIHLVDRCRHSLDRGLNVNAALADALVVAGPSIVINAFGVTIGFGVLVLSQVPANARLGLLFTISMASCLVGTFILPALISLRTPRGQSARVDAAEALPVENRPVS